MSITPISSGTNPITWVPPKDSTWVQLMRPAADLAVQIADTEFVPAEFRNRPGAIAACILYGAELGLGPMQSLAKVDVVKGRPAPRAELGRALALAAGHEIWVEETTNTRVVMKGHRRGSSHVFTVAWTMDDARKAGIAGNPAYAKYPRQMLLARASAELVRQMCPDVTGGIVMFAEEAADADTLDTPTSIPAQTSVAPSGTQKRSRRTKTPEPKPKHDGEPGEMFDPNAPHPADEAPDKPTEAQTKMAMALFTEIGIVERDDRIAATNALTRHVESWNDLDRNEASIVIDALTKVRDGGITFHITDQGVWETIATPNGDDLLDGDGDD
jgi:hypothetical protein